MRILIGIPSNDSVKADFSMSLATMIGMTCTKFKGVQVAVFNAKGCHVDRNRFYTVKEAQGMQADYLLFLDSDMVFPPQLLARLVSSDKDVIGCNYVKRTSPHGTFAYYPDGTLVGNIDSGIVEVGRIGTGAMLINMKVFDKLPEPYFENKYIGDGTFDSGDFRFCDLAREHGFKIFCDLDISKQIGHIGSETSYIETEEGRE
ncbi:hypothetical protein KAR91_12195 [Candidatus Pacearchaeota archaeon]|nr:hypothetical protein [Candidatus Pacearchaeota archaeon]